MAAVALLAGALGGCLGDPDPRAEKLERLIKVETAQALLTDTGVPTPPADSPRVQEAADQLDVSCESKSRRGFECETDWGEGRKIYCAVTTNDSITRVASNRCGQQGVPETRTADVDCGTVGEQTDLSDPAGDVFESNPARPVNVSATPAAVAADLERVRVAVDSDALCVDWRVRGVVEPPYFLHVWLRPGESRDTQLALSVTLQPDKPPEVGLLSFGDFDATVDVRGNSVSMLIERDELPESRHAVFDGPPFTVLARVSNEAGYFDEFGP